MPHFAVSAVGADRPGIVAAVTKVLVGQGCNLEDTSMSILRGHFAMMLVVSAGEGLDAAVLEAALGEPAGALDLVVAVRAIDDSVPKSAPGDRWSVSVYGADKPGIVHAVTQLLADLGVNVEDLATRVIGGSERPVYAMLLDVIVPETVAANTLSARLDALAEELGVECSAHPSDADIL